MTPLTQITNPHTNDYSRENPPLNAYMRPLFEFLTAKSIHDKSNLHFFYLFSGQDHVLSTESDRKREQ